MADRLALDATQEPADLINELQDWAAWLEVGRDRWTEDLLRDAIAEILRTRAQRDTAIADRDQVVRERDQVLAALVKTNERYTCQVNRMHRRAQAAEGVMRRAGLSPSRPRGAARRRGGAAEGADARAEGLSPTRLRGT